VSKLPAYTHEFRESAVGRSLSGRLGIRNAAEYLELLTLTLHDCVRAARRSEAQARVELVAEDESRCKHAGARAYSRRRISAPSHRVADHAGAQDPSDVRQKAAHGGAGRPWPQASPDLLEGDLSASGPNRKSLCDIIDVPTDEGFREPHGPKRVTCGRDGHRQQRGRSACRNPAARKAADASTSDIATLTAILDIMRSLDPRVSTDSNRGSIEGHQTQWTPCQNPVLRGPGPT
jgi:hypothetical protein